jgi:hypothetical protein
LPAERLLAGGGRAILLLFLILGTLFTFFLPPFQVPDEVAHWETAVYRSEIFPGRDRPVCSASYALPVVLDVDSVRFHPENKFHTGNFEKLAAAKPVCAQFPMGYGTTWTYFPVALLHWLFPSAHRDARIALRLFYASRALHGIFLAFLAWRLLRAAERRAGASAFEVRYILIVMLSPLYVQQAFAVSADVIVNAFAMSAATLLVAGLGVGGVDMLLFTLIGAAGLTTKPIILPVALLVPLAVVWSAPALPPVGASPFDVHKKRILAAIAVALTALTLAYVLFGVSAEGLDMHLPDVDARAQVAFARAHPRVAGGAILGRMGDLWRLSKYVAPLGWHDTPVSPAVVGLWDGTFLVHLAVGVYLLFRVLRRRRDERRLLRSLMMPALLLLGLASSAFVTVFVLYCTWTRVGAHVVMGVQQRYFLPHLVVALAVVSGLTRDEDATAMPSPRAAFLSGALVLGLVALSVAYVVLIATDLAVRYW